MTDRKDRSYDVVISFFNETDENLIALEILLLKLCSTEYELNSCFNHVYNYKYNQQCTIPMIAVLEGRLNLVQMLFKNFRKSIDLEIKGTIRCRDGLFDGITALCAAVYIGNLDMIKLLIENGADVNTVSNYNATPLHIATHHNRVDIVKYLIEEAHGDVHRVNKRNTICLNVAGIQGNTKLIEYLLQQPGTDINHQDIDGQTTLHFAVIKNEIDAIKLLLSYKVRIDIKNVQNMTPLELAAQNGNEEAVNYILSIEDLVDVKEKIEALELLGASLICNNLKQPDFEKAYQYFMQAMILRLSSGNVKTKSTILVQPIAAYNYRTECVSIAELESIRNEPEILRLEALLVHERLLLPKKSSKLINCILDESWEYAYEYPYDRCIYLWFHGLELCIVNDDMNMNIEDLRERMMYISYVMRDLGETYCVMVSMEYETIPTKIFCESFKMAINQFRRLYRKATGTENVSLVYAHDYFVRSILFLIYVSTKVCRRNKIQ
jgi:ankyrin repeat protein